MVLVLYSHSDDHQRWTLTLDDVAKWVVMCTPDVKETAIEHHELHTCAPLPHSCFPCVHCRIESMWREEMAMRFPKFWLFLLLAGMLFADKSRCVWTVATDGCYVPFTYYHKSFAKCLSPKPVFYFWKIWFVDTFNLLTTTTFLTQSSFISFCKFVTPLIRSIIHKKN